MKEGREGVKRREESKGSEEKRWKSKGEKKRREIRS